MNIKEANLLSVEACREAMQQFWSAQSAVEREGQGVVMALPLMYPDGWQVVVHLEPLSKAKAIITDKGRTLANLTEAGLNYDARAKQTYEILEDRKRTFELIQDGFELKKEIRLPVDGIDIQLFAESLVSVAHLIYRYEPVMTTENVAYRTIQKVFAERELTPKTNFALSGKIEKVIRVDFYMEGRRPLACEVVKRRGPLLGYMEQWAWRWTDLHNENDRLFRAMIYDPDQQDWDDTSTNLGRGVCDLFCPYFETKPIHQVLDEITKAV